MNKKIFSILSISLLLLFTACNKETVQKEEGNIISIVGKWRHAETYYGYVNGGDFQWHQVAADDSHTYQFMADGKYLLQNGAANGNSQCFGTYQLVTSDSLEIISGCQTANAKIKISELTSRNLVFDRQGREGIIRYKYIAVK